VLEVPAGRTHTQFAPSGTYVNWSCVAARFSITAILLPRKSSSLSFMALKNAGERAIMSALSRMAATPLGDAAAAQGHARRGAGATACALVGCRLDVVPVQAADAPS
jgi:hypothetical protein